MSIKSVMIDWRFILLILAVVVIQVSLLKIVLQFGFTAEEWWILLYYKLAEHIPGFLGKYFHTLQVGGVYHTYQIVYIGVLESFFKGNYPAYQITTIVLKILATISLYPLILKLFKRKLLAFLTVILYSMSFSSAGAFLYVCIGSDYAAIFVMNLFLLAYYGYHTAHTTKKRQLLFLSAVLLFISFMFSPIRMYPLLGLVLVIELFIWVLFKKSFTFKSSLGRLAVLFVPFLLLLIITFKSTGSNLSSPLVVFDFIFHGNYHLLLLPFAGLGYTFFTNEQWPYFGSIAIESFKDYLLFLLRGPLTIYPILTIPLGLLIFRRKLLFSALIIIVNIIFQLVCYLLIINLIGQAGPYVKIFQIGSTNSVFFGFFVTTVAVASLVTWLKNKKSNLLFLAFAAGPIFSNLFFWGTWLLKGDVLNFKEGIHWYMVTAAIGSSLFLASLMVLIFDKIKKITNKSFKYVLVILLFLSLILIYLNSGKEINKTFESLLKTGYKASDQEYIRNILAANMKEPLDKNPALFYFEPNEEIFYPISMLYGFNEMMHIRDWKLVDGCTAYIYDQKILEESVTIKDGIKGFHLVSLCIKNSREIERPDAFYTVDNFYAFRLKDKNIINIKQDVLNHLGF